MAVFLLVGSVVFALVLPSQFKWPDRVAIVGFFALVAWVLHLLGRMRVSADEDGITVVNALRTHRYAWAEVLGVYLPDAEPWPRLDLADGSTVGAMGIQGSEKARAAEAVMELRALIEAKGEAPD